MTDLCRIVYVLTTAEGAYASEFNVFRQ